MLKLTRRIGLALIVSGAIAARVGLKLMRRNALLLVSFSLACVALAQTRVDSFNASDVEVNRLLLTPLPDGGCRAEWCGKAESADGGAQLGPACVERELKSGAARNACTGLVDLGLTQVGRALRFDVDAGNP